ncbi:hypothetical protein COBT_002160 [Conglomerata obtusa]
MLDTEKSSDCSTNDCTNDFIEAYSGYDEMSQTDAQFLKDFFVKKKWQEKVAKCESKNIEKESKKEKIEANNITEEIEYQKATLSAPVVPKYKSFNEVLASLNETDCNFEYQPVEKENFGMTNEDLLCVEESLIDQKFYKKSKKNKKSRN